MERDKSVIFQSTPGLSPTEQQASFPLRLSETPDQEIYFPTGLGNITFADLCTRTRRYAAYVLSHRYHMRPEFVDEALHVGYSRVWEKLNEKPGYFQEKEVPAIGQQVVFQALHGLQKEWRYQRKTVAYEGSTSGQHSRAHSTENRQSDLRIDVHQAILQVANCILATSTGKHQLHDLWALYGLTALQTNARETAQLFGVREQTMQKAFQRSKQQLRDALTAYAPMGPTRPVRQWAPRSSKLKTDIHAVREKNKNIPDAVIEAVRDQIMEIKADTQLQDELALDGIKSGRSALAQGRIHNIDVAKIQRAYNRVHLMIAAVNDPTVRPPKPEKRQQYMFALNPGNERAVHDLALELEKQPKSFERLVALHAHINNLPISRTAKNFNIPTATLRNYVQQIGKRLGTPLQRAGDDRRGYMKSPKTSQAQSVMGAD